MADNNLPSQYNPKDTEDKWYKFWEENNLFSAKVNPSKKPFCIVIPPPNVTGILHMGHALNNTYQDILIRLKRMQGFESLWMPGTDHAGIATQNVVERQIAKEGLRRQDLGRDKFLKKVWLWKEQYGSTITKQLKKLGSSCDWARERFTMDEAYSASVKEVFVRLYEDGLIYQGSYIINWCPRCQTALSDEEAVHHDIDGNLYYVKYPLKRSAVTSPRSAVKKSKSGKAARDYIVVATTRPETMLGDTAVAVNPKDKRYKHLIGQILILPLMERQIKIIADELVDPKFGTGAVKVTPAHDPNDYEMGMRHSLEFINIMHPDGLLNTAAGEYAGMDRFEAREAIIEDLKERKLLEKVKPHKHAVGHCYRCHTIVEPYLSKQWFVKMKPLAKPAIEAVKKGNIKFHPNRWSKVYLNWMENIRDWCISRQIWWGHRIPVYYCKKCQETGILKSKIKNKKSKIEQSVIVSGTKPDKCSVCGSTEIYQDEDVLDTWFSSWLWPFATFYAPQGTGYRVQGTERNPNPEPRTLNPDLNYFYPTSVLVTAPEIIFFWVARMIMSGFKFMGKEPFKDVYIHGTVRDVEGKKMSKSLGNIIDPLSIIDKYGADALRFSLISITSTGQDVYLSEQKFELGRNFANKLWNASRFSLANLNLDALKNSDGKIVDLCVIFEKEKLGLPERWILSRFYSTLLSLNKALDNYRFNDAANILYEFIWHEFCDWYLEMIKPSLVTSDQRTVAGREKNTQIVLYKLLEKTLRCLHPFMPFITEEIWQKLKGLGAGSLSSVESIMTEPWPHVQKQIIDKKCEHKVKVMIDVISAIRNLRASMRIKEGDKVKVVVVAGDSDTEKLLQETSGYIINLSRLESLSIERSRQKSRNWPSAKTYSSPEFVGVDDQFRSGMGKCSCTTKNIASSIVRNIEVFLLLEGLIDISAEVNKISKEIERLDANIKATQARLKNKDFFEKAPEEIVEKEKAKLENLKETIKKLKELKDGLK